MPPDCANRAGDLAHRHGMPNTDLDVQTKASMLAVAMRARAQNQPQAEGTWTPRIASTNAGDQVTHLCQVAHALTHTGVVAEVLTATATSIATQE